MKKKGFIFDLDGVIVDTAKYHFLAWKKLAAQLGIVFTEDHNEQFKGVSRRRCLEILLQMGKLEVSTAQFESWLIEKNKDYLTYIARMDETEILPDVTKVLQYLKSNTIPLAVGSASKNAVPILEKLNLLSYFDVIVDGTQVTTAKPDPEVFLIAASRLGVAPQNCIVFEDAIAGIAAANAAGMVSVGIGDPEVLNQAQYIFKDFTQIEIDFIKERLA